MNDLSETPFVRTFPSMIFIRDDNKILFDHMGCGQYFTLNELLIIKKKTLLAINFAKKNDIKLLNDKIENDHIKSMYDSARERDRIPKPPKIGFVYLMRDESLDLIKIGWSRNPSYRESTLQAEKPTITLLIQWQASLKFERILHDAFANNRVRGEWFNVSESEICEFVKLNQHRLHEK